MVNITIINFFCIHFPGFICSTVTGSLRKKSQTKHKQKKTKTTTQPTKQQHNQPNNINKNTPHQNQLKFFFPVCSTVLHTQVKDACNDYLGMPAQEHLKTEMT